MLMVDFYGLLPTSLSKLEKLLTTSGEDGDMMRISGGL